MPACTMHACCPHAARGPVAAGSTRWAGHWARVAACRMPPAQLATTATTTKAGARDLQRARHCPGGGALAGFSGCDGALLRQAADAVVRASGSGGRERL